MINAIRRLMFRRNRSVRYYKYFLSYMLIVLMLLAVISGVMDSQFLRTFKTEVENANIAALMQVRDTLDVRFNEMQRIALQIAENPLLTPYMLTNSGYQWFQSVKELNKYRFGNTFLFNLGIVFNHETEQKLYTADGVYQMQYFFDTIFKFENWNEDQFLRTTSTIHLPLIRPMENVMFNNSSAQMRIATYLYPLPSNAKDPYATAVFFMNELTMTEYVSPLLKKYNGSFFLINKQNEPIFSAGDELDHAELQELWKHVRTEPLTEQVNSAMIQNTTYSVVKLPSVYHEWSYVTVIPTDRFLQPVQTSRRTITIVLLGLLLLGLALSVSLANINYRKLRELVHIFGERDGSKATHTSEDEFVYLSGALRETTRNETMMARLNSRTGLLREKLLLSLLQGKSDKLYELDNLFEVSGIHFAYPRYKVLLLEIDDSVQFLQQYSASMHDLFKFSVINVAEELAGEIGKGYGIDLSEGRGVAIVLNIPELVEENSAIQDIAVKIQQFFKTYYKFSLSIGVGRSCEQLSALHSSFLDAERALYYRFLKGNEQILIHEELYTETPPAARSGYQAGMEELLLKALRQGKADEAEQTIRSLLASIAASSATPVTAQASCTGLLHRLIQTMDGWEEASGSHWKIAFEALLTNPYETIAHLERELIQLCRGVCDSVAMGKESRNFDLRDNILSFINTHYADNTLSLESIASRFGMSPSYITRFMKDQTGHSLIRYLGQIRLQRAKELLRTTHSPIMEITEQVGYVDTMNFIRNFKKAEGVTPAQYRLLYIDRTSHFSGSEEER
jgi:two-component system response regulator YesN